MHRSNANWRNTLQDSVFALGAACREYRAAQSTAQAALWSIELTRVRPVDGELSIPGAYRHRPHDAALWSLEGVYTELNYKIRSGYENKALAYAYGAAWAVRAVLAQQDPSQVEMARKGREYVPPHTDLRQLGDELADWTDRHQLAELGAEVIHREEARALGEEPSESDWVPEYEARAIAAAAEYAEGLAEAAYAYGECAERALHFVLIGAQDREYAEGSRA